MKLEKTPSFIG